MVELVQEETFNLSQFQNEAQAPQKKKTAAWVILLFLAFFPPVAFYLLWKDKSRHRWLASLSRLFGASLIIFGIFFNFYVLPQVNTVIREFSPKMIQTNASGLIWLTIILGIGQFIFGFFIKGKFNKDGELAKNYLFVCFAFLILDYVLPFWVYLMTITPLYDSIL